MKSLNELIELAQSKGTKQIVVAAADDLPVLQAVHEAMKLSLVAPVLVGNKDKIQSLSAEIGLDLGNITILNESDPLKASILAVKQIKETKNGILMKGLVGTAAFLKSILNKENGLNVTDMLCHLALCECPFYSKIIGVSDVAININPTFNDKVIILHHCISVYHKLGYNYPKIAVIAPVELVNEKIESTVHASMLSMMYQRQQFTGCIIDGPLALDTAISAEATSHKGIKSEVAGDADLLLVPDLNSGNILYKSLVYAGKAVTAAIVLGAGTPIVLTSRADSEKSKLLSIALASILE